MALTIYGANVSPFVRKTRVFLAEKGIGYAHENVNIFDPPDWFLEISPARRIPVLRDTGIAEDFTLPDSSVICAYLERRYPEPALYPKDDADYGWATFLEEYADSDMAPVIGGGIFRPGIVFPLMKGVAPDDDAVADTVANKLPQFLDYLESRIKGREFLIGDRLTIADIGVGSQFCNLRHAEVTPDAGRWPELAAFVERLHARDSFAACLAEEAPIFSREAVLARLAKG